MRVRRLRGKTDWAKSPKVTPDREGHAMQDTIKYSTNTIVHYMLLHIQAGLCLVLVLGYNTLQ